MKLDDRFCGCLLGLAAGDAVGTTVEFYRRGTFEPVTDMVGGGPFGLAPGQWTDDTSMALCLAASLVERAWVRRGRPDGPLRALVETGIHEQHRPLPIRPGRCADRWRALTTESTLSRNRGASGSPWPRSSWTWPIR
jgi:hypothetical protein